MKCHLKSPVEDIFRLSRTLINEWKDLEPRIKKAWNLADDDLVKTEEGRLSVKTALGRIDAMPSDVILKLKDGSLFVLYDQVFDTLFEAEI